MAVGLHESCGVRSRRQLRLGAVSLFGTHDIMWRTLRLRVHLQDRYAVEADAKWTKQP